MFCDYETLSLTSTINRGPFINLMAIEEASWHLTPRKKKIKVLTHTFPHLRKICGVKLSSTQMSNLIRTKFIIICI